MSGGPSNNRVEPRFFGAPELYNKSPAKKEPVWPDESSNPPPPYTPSEPSSSSAASAPPLELTPEYSIYTPVHYGTIPQPYPANNTPDVVATPTWPWISPPRAPEPLYQRSPSEYDAYASPPTKKKTLCERLVQIMFYLFCFCLLFRLIDLLVNGVEFAGSSCAHGVEWTAVPKQIEYFAGLNIRVIGGRGSLSSGKITIRTITSDSVGTVHATALVSPSLIHNSDLSFTISRFPNGTTLEFYIPQGLSSRACVRLDAVIYVPAGTPYLNVQVQNSHIVVSDETIDVEQLSLGTTNSDIDMYPAWSGKTLSLSTKNGHLELYRSIEATDSIELVSTNGMIRARENVNAVNLVYVSTTNGAINIDKEVSSEKYTKLITTNGHILAHNVTGNAVEVRTSNGRVKVNHGHVTNTYDVQSTNAKMEVTLDSGKNVQATLRTSNGELTATFPNNFEGLFDVGTSSYDKVSLVDPLGWAHLKKVTKSHLSGTRYSNTQQEEETSDGFILMETSNDNIHLNFFAKEN
ncbi:hypothetical protein HPULCUR_007597 [Helicostylum pulchrum]|uniref:DUF4097 domain-containing protein n=1 Tax=Helicostylum pulchrum TaxID=562976 RepID=A0ABP9Y5A1_9FUNG